MTQPGVESGTDLVLDSRKLIVGFLILIIVCGAFFVIGFMEGKRQSVLARLDQNPAAPAGGTASPSEKPPAKVEGTMPQTAAVEDRSARDRLDWYKNAQGDKPGTPAVMNPTKNEPGKGAAPAASGAVASGEAKPKAAADATKPTSFRSMVPADKVSYTVQVGAFRQRREAEVKLAALKAKGYVCELEPPKSANQLFLVKVGKFASRADAKEMQLRLEKDGFSSFIKVN